MDEASRFRRDMDFVRRLLFEMERVGHVAHPDQLGWPEEDSQKVAYHLSILEDSGLLTAVYDGYGKPNHWRLSWQGHDFIDSVRSDTNWNKVQDATERAGGFTLAVVMQIAQQLVLTAAKQHLGM